MQPILEQKCGQDFNYDYGDCEFASTGMPAIGTVGPVITTSSSTPEEPTSETDTTRDDNGGGDNGDSDGGDTNSDDDNNDGNNDEEEEEGEGVPTGDAALPQLADHATTVRVPCMYDFASGIWFGVL